MLEDAELKEKKKTEDEEDNMKKIKKPQDCQTDHLPVALEQQQQ